MPRYSAVLAIRRMLVERGEVSPWDAWLELRAEAGLAYMTVTRYFHVLRTIGLIEEARREPNSKLSPIPKVYYRIKPGKEDDPCWFNPWTCYRALKSGGTTPLRPR